MVASMSLFDHLDDLSGDKAEQEKRPSSGDNLPVLPAEPVEEPKSEDQEVPLAGPSEPEIDSEFAAATPLTSAAVEDAVLVSSTTPVERLSSKYSEQPQRPRKRVLIYGVGLLLLGLLVAVAVSGKKPKQDVATTSPTYAPATAVSPTAIYGSTAAATASIPETTTPQVIVTGAATTALQVTTNGISQAAAARQQAIAKMDLVQQAVERAGKKLPSSISEIASYLSSKTGLPVTTAQSAPGDFSISLIGSKTLSVSYRSKEDISVTRLISIPGR